MKHSLMFVLTVMAAAASSACADDADLARVPGAGAGGAAGNGGTGGAGGANAGAGGVGGRAGSTGSAGAAGSPEPPPPALPDNAPTVACPSVITGALEASDPTQRGRHSRLAPVSACGMSKAYPGNAADPTNPHLFDVYRFINPGATAACFSFTLTDGTSTGPVDADAGSEDAGPQDAGPLDAGEDAAAVPAGPGPQKYLTAHEIFYPTELGRSHLGDVGANLVSPQTMGITVAAGETIDVVVYAVDIAPAGVGAYTLSCSVQ